MDSTVLLIVLPVFLVIALGFVLRRVGLVSAELLFALNRLIYYIALPALLFYKISTADFAANFNPALLGGLVVTTLAIFLFSSAYAALRGYSPAVNGAFSQAAFRGNLAYIGLAIVYSAYGEEGFTVAGILLGFLVPQLNLQSVLALTLPHRRQSQEMGRSFFIRQVLGNPLLLASLLGILWSFYDLPVPVVIDRSLAIVTGMSLPLALISIGASFSFKKFRGDIAVAALATLLKIVISPALAALILIVLGVRDQELAIGILLAGCPTATAAYIMAQQLRCDAELSATIIMLSTLGSLVTFTGSLYLLQHLAS